MAGAVNACGHAHMVFIFAPLGLALWPPRTENPRGVGPLGLNFSIKLPTCWGQHHKIICRPKQPTRPRCCDHVDPNALDLMNKLAALLANGSGG